MTADLSPVQMIRACSPNLDQRQLVTTGRRLRGVEITSGVSTDVCPSHGDPILAVGRSACLDNFWSQRYLAGLSLVEAWRLWRSWRQEARP